MNLRNICRSKLSSYVVFGYVFQSHSSPRSTPNSSPKSRTTHSPPIPPPPPRAASTPSTPGDSLSSVGGDVRQAFGQHPPSSASSVRSLRQDLLVAADSVTNAMSSLVKELNSGDLYIQAHKLDFDNYNLKILSALDGS